MHYLQQVALLDPISLILTHIKSKSLSGISYEEKLVELLLRCFIITMIVREK